MSTYIVVIFAFWLAVLSWLLYKTKEHYHQLIAKTKKGTIGEILKSLIDQSDITVKKTEKIEEEIKQLIESKKLHYQKTGLVRFNPFERVGGEQSFILTLLNQQDSGLVINFLYTREGIRVYAKKIRQGVSKEYELSSEEKEAVKKAD